MGDVGTFLGCWWYFRGKWRRTRRTKKDARPAVYLVCLWRQISPCVWLKDEPIPPPPVEKAPKLTFEYNQHQIRLTSWNQTVCFSAVGIPPTQCIKSALWIHCRTRSRARSRLMQRRRFWSPSSRAAMSSLPHIWKLFVGRVLRKAASVKCVCVSHLKCSSAPWDLN